MQRGILTALLLLATPRATREITVKDLTADETRLVQDSRDGQLDEFDAVTAGLAACRTPPTRAAAASARWRSFLEEVKAGLAAAPPRERAESLLGALHQSLLKGGYGFEQNDMATLLLEGRYNCVTSSLAYQAAGAALGLDVRGVLVPSHVYIRVVIDGTNYDVETTSPKGFLLHQDDAAYQEFLRRMQLSTERMTGEKIDTSEAFFRRETDPIDLIALLYANLGAMAVHRGNIQDAIGLFARSALLAKDERYARDSRDTLLGQAGEQRLAAGDLPGARSMFRFALADPGGDPGIVARFKESIGYTWALEGDKRLKASEYQGAIDAFAEGTKWSSDPALMVNQKATWGLWGLKELDAGRYPQAIDIFTRARRVFPEEPEFKQNLKAAFYQQMQVLTHTGQADQALLLGETLRGALPGDPEVDTLYAQTAMACSDGIARKQGWESAAEFLQRAYTKVPADRPLAVKLSAAWNNAGVAAMKAGDADSAASDWRRSIEADPSDTVARKNLDNMPRRKN